jgi:hypothetical protein
VSGKLIRLNTLLGKVPNFKTSPNFRLSFRVSAHPESNVHT